MRVLVTGAAGFIGSAVQRRLDAAGIASRAFDRALDHNDDICTLDRVRAATRGCDAIIHLAAKVGLGVSVADLDDYVRHNDLGTAVVLRAAAEAGVARVVYASSMVIYGEGAYRCPVDGPTRPAPRRAADLAAGIFDPPCSRCGSTLAPELVAEDAEPDPRNVYAATKLHGEHLAAAWSRETDGVVAALRFHNVYGPGLPRDTPYAGVAALFVSQVAAGRPAQVYEDGRQRRDFVHVDDVAAAVVAATRAELPTGVTPLNIGSGTVTTIAEMATAITAVTDGPAPIVTGQYRLGDVRHVTADSSRARHTLGWTPQVSLADGVAGLVNEQGGKTASSST